jgi:DNA-directed RNA polymerase specialized sigma subunit
MSKHIETRSKIKSIADISSFNDLLEASTLSATDKQILILHYIEGKDFRYIGDMLGFAESTIKHKHRRIISKLGKLI